MEVPTETVVQNLNGVQQYIKTFTVSPDADPQELIEEPFEYCIAVTSFQFKIYQSDLYDSRQLWRNLFRPCYRDGIRGCW